jgi:transposase
MSKSSKKTFRSRVGSLTLLPPFEQYGVGLDVHKFKIAVCITGQVSDGTIVTVKEHVFRATPYGVNELINFLKKYTPVKYYLMECTGIYHLPIYHALQDAFPDASSRVVAMNPLMIHRRIGDLGKHADRTDARGISVLTHYGGLVRPSYVGNLEFFRLRQLIRYYHKTRTEVTRVKNRLRQLMDTENFKFPIELNSEWSLLLLDYFINRSIPFGQAFNEFISKLEAEGKGTSVIEKRRVHVNEYKMFRFKPTTLFTMRINLKKYLYLENECVEYLIHAESLILDNKDFNESYEKLLEIPAIGSVSALTILLEIGDYHRFNGWKPFTKFCGVVPLIDQSGERRVKGHVNRYTNARLRQVLTQSAAILINISKKDTDLARYAHNQYRVKGMPYKKALLKVGHKLARTIYNLLVLGIDYDPNYESIQRKRKLIQHTKLKRGTLLESSRTRAVRRDISQFLVANYDFLNSTSKYHIISGFERLIRKSEYNLKNDLSKISGRSEKKKKTISNRGE